MGPGRASCSCGGACWRWLPAERRLCWQQLPSLPLPSTTARHACLCQCPPNTSLLLVLPCTHCSFACLFTSHVSNLIFYSPLKSYRAKADVMVHEDELAGSGDW